jgi:quercetin dioxygenase-like cupin family protein
MSILVSNSLDNLVRIIGVHGGSGALHWKCFARLHMLDSELVAFEYVRLEPGGVVGEHVHSRTDEIYFVVSGNADMTTDGEVGRIGPGDLVLSRIGTRHGAVAGDDGLEFLVIELFPEAVARQLPEYAAAAER